MYSLSRSANEILCVKLFRHSEESEALHECQVLANLRNHAHYFVQLVGWARVGGYCALIMSAIPVNSRHYSPSSMSKLLRYASSLCEVCLLGARVLLSVYRLLVFFTLSA